MPRGSLDIIEEAIGDLCRLVTLAEVEGPTSHTAVVADGLDDPGVPPALGHYLLGVIAGAVQLDATLADHLMPRGVDGRAEIDAQVRKAIGDTNTFVTDQEKYFRDRVRNAWIGEGLGHAMFIVRNRQDTACLHGRVEAVTEPHAEPSQSGLDAVAIYAVDGEPFVAIEEAKSTNERGLEELRKAAGFFADVDKRRYGPHLRAHLIALRHAVPSALRNGIAEAIVRDAACYLPVIVHGMPFKHLEDRNWLASLTPPVDRRRLLVMRIGDFHGFFDTVADTMRAEAHTVVL